MKYIYLLLPLVYLTTSCGKFLEEYATDQKYVETTADLKSLMIGEAYINNVTFSIYNQATMGTLTSETGITAPWLHVMDDDSEPFLVNNVATDQSTPFYMLSGFHNWSQEPARNILNMEWTDVFWRKLYKRIGALNAILFQAANIAEKTPEDNDLKHLRGEAYFLRAYYYFLLQNTYGSPYHKSTAASDDGIPLKISEKVEDRYFKRDKNETIYRQIVADLDQAANYFGNYNPVSKLQVGIAAVKILQSRVYLYTEEYAKALAVLDGFELMGYIVSDLNQYVQNTNFSARSSSETVFTMGPNVIPTVFMNDSVAAYGGNDRRASAFKSSDNLMESFESDDLRPTAFFMRSAKNKAWLPAKYRTWRTNNDPEQVSCLFSFRAAEVLLNRAEAMAMLGLDAQARNELQSLRQKRLKIAAAGTLPQSNAALVEYIRKERRRELCFEGHRWFDLRRYAVNTRYPLAESFTIKHPTYNYDAQSDTHTRVGYFVLQSVEKDPACWQVPIPNYAIEFNRGDLTNPVRSARTVQPL
ncbi:MAG: RagB/SusD family nutrient uptake outer membrane protein [Sphingobacterium sp.]|jgi:hypothetical protein|nr:RagB/SusD family nutrient uptake outer membrane protein [Sphingobacterium sp.]